MNTKCRNRCYTTQNHIENDSKRFETTTSKHIYECQSATFLFLLLYPHSFNDWKKQSETKLQTNKIPIRSHFSTFSLFFILQRFSSPSPSLTHARAQTHTVTAGGVLVAFAFVAVVVVVYEEDGSISTAVSVVIVVVIVVVVVSIGSVNNAILILVDPVARGIVGFGVGVGCGCTVVD
jgi:hypothetical protein